MSEETRLRLVKINWVDSRGVQSHWAHLSDQETSICRCVSVGFVMAENDEFIDIAPHHAGDQTCGNMTIPKVCITKIEDIANE